MRNIKKAAALEYENNYDTPIVTAAGMGIIAENIIKKAEESNVPIVYNKEMAELLSNVDVGESIPSELYEAVAKIIVYVMDMDRSKK
jgi:flagellar biosynthesis protein